MQKGLVWIIVLVVVVGGFFIFRGGEKAGVDDVSRDLGEPIGNGVVDTAGDGGPAEPVDISGVVWLNAELRDVNSGETFTIRGIGPDEGKKVLLESMAVWCPVCTRQQREIRKLHDEGNEIVSVSLDTDPNEDEARLRSHTDKNGFTWRYAISPSDVTRSLIDDFDPSIINAPSAPMVLVCEDGSWRRLPNGVKSISTLRQEIERGC